MHTQYIANDFYHQKLITVIFMQIVLKTDATEIIPNDFMLQFVKNIINY